MEQNFDKSHVKTLTIINFVPYYWKFDIKSDELSIFPHQIFMLYGTRLGFVYSVIS